MREQKLPFACFGCGLVELPGNYPFTVCDDCWDKTYPPKHLPSVDRELLAKAAYEGARAASDVPEVLRMSAWEHAWETEREHWRAEARAVLADLFRQGFVVVRKKALRDYLSGRGVREYWIELEEELTAAFATAADAPDGAADG